VSNNRGSPAGSRATALILPKDIFDRIHGQYYSRTLKVWKVAERLAAFAKGQAPTRRRKPRYRLAAQLGPFQALLKRTFEQGGPPAARAALACQRRMPQGPDARSSSRSLPRQYSGWERMETERHGRCSMDARTIEGNRATLLSQAELLASQTNATRPALAIHKAQQTLRQPIFPSKRRKGRGRGLIRHRPGEQGKSKIPVFLNTNFGWLIHPHSA
jgi:hypothetical protein